MRIFYSDHFPVPLPDGHRFPMQKYALLRRRVAAARLGELLIPAPASDEQLCLAHAADYVRRVGQGELTEREIRRIGFPWSPALVERSRRSVGGTIAASRAALEDGWAANLAGGTHHAYADHGEGYCVFNDVAVAARVMQAEGRVRRAVVLDCDVHQGNGTAAIFAGDSSVFTFSIHGARNFPFHKEPSDLDVALPDASDDEAFLTALAPAVEEAIERSDADLAYYIAGADPFFDDRLGRMQLTKAGLLRRDRLVFTACQGAGLPVVVVMGGGYARQVEDTVDIQFNSVRLAAEFARLDRASPTLPLR